jgi:hypothetical protein
LSQQSEHKQNWKNPFTPKKPSIFLCPFLPIPRHLIENLGWPSVLKGLADWQSGFQNAMSILIISPVA